MIKYGFEDLLWRTISYNDYHEDYYHAFLAGAFVGIGYEVESNKEKGLGRPDILLKDDDNRRAIIIEAKKSKKNPIWIRTSMKQSTKSLQNNMQRDFMVTSRYCAMG